MAIEIRLPNITGITEREQLAQVKSYLYQLAQQLQWALGTVGTSSGQAAAGQITSKDDASMLPSGVVAQTTFNALKPLIIKSADIVDAYYKEINSRLKGEYVAQSDFGTYLRYGLLYYDDNDVPIYGLEIGQKNVIDGEEVFNKYARFISNRLSLYDQNGLEVAYISDNKLSIVNVEVLVSIKIGGLKEIVLANGDIVEKAVDSIPTEEVFLHKAGSIGSLGIGEYVSDENVISIAKNKHIRMKSSLNGVRMYNKSVSGTNELDINTKYADFSGTGNERQTFFIFGEANGSMVYGLARVDNNGTTKWAGTEGVTLQTKTGGVLTVVLPNVAYDIFTIISGREFTV